MSDNKPANVPDIPVATRNIFAKRPKNTKSSSYCGAIKKSNDGYKKYQPSEMACDTDVKISKRLSLLEIDIIIWN
jgi:hypothetical protein